MIEHIPTGKYYIGKKNLKAKRTLPPLKEKRGNEKSLKNLTGKNICPPINGLKKKYLMVVRKTSKRRYFNSVIQQKHWLITNYIGNSNTMY